MNRVAHFLLLLLLSSPAMADIVVFGNTLSFSEGCTLEVKNDESGKANKFDLGLAFDKSCSFVNHGRTNIPHIESVKAYYILIAESDLDTDRGCEHVGIILSREGEVLIGSRKLRSGSCGQAKERHHFEYILGISEAK